MRRLLALIASIFLSSTVAFACSCFNDRPIQKSDPYYSERAVFTAHVVKLIGKIYNFGGKRRSDVVIAKVNRMYWGIPEFWPSYLVLDGKYPCDITMEEDDDLLVSGKPGIYGVLSINLCSGTVSLKQADVDLLTLDGVRCGSPGGTLIGRVAQDDGTTVLGAVVTVTDPNGRVLHTESALPGIYEVDHLAPGPYAVSVSVPGRASPLKTSVTVLEGRCVHPSVFVPENKPLP